MITSLESVACSGASVPPAMSGYRSTFDSIGAGARGLMVTIVQLGCTNAPLPVGSLSYTFDFSRPANSAWLGVYL